MNKKISLPVIEPCYGTYHYQGSGAAIIGANESILNYYLNEAVNLYCNRHFLYGGTTLGLGVVKSTYSINPHLEKVHFLTKYLGEHIHHVIHALIDDGFYVYYTGIDDYYLEGKTFYKEKHFKNDGMICGYDDEKNTYSVYAYDSNWEYQVFEISQKSFEKGRVSKYIENDDAFITGLRPKTNHVNFSPWMVIRCIKSYLNSNFYIYPTYIAEEAYGLVVHEYLKMYLDKLADGIIPKELMDRKVFRQLWEHKELMLKRILKMESELEMDAEFSEKYTPVVDLAKKIRVQYENYRLSDQKELIYNIKDSITEICEKEKTILKDFADKTENIMLKR